MDRSPFVRAQRHTELHGLGPVPLDVAYRDVGEGPPVLLLHGIATWSYLWEGVIDQLAEASRVVAPDLLGYGHSDHRDCFDRSVRRQARMVARLMDRVGLPAATVVGHDIGGAVAQVLAVDYTERVNGLVLVDSVAYDSWPSTSMCELGDPNLVGQSDDIMRILRRDARKGHADSADADAFEADMVAPYDSEEGRRSMVRNASALTTNHTMELADALPDLDLPALVVWGEEDPWQPLADAERLADDLDADLVTVPEGAHWLPYDHPAETAQPIRTFVTAD